MAWKKHEDYVDILVPITHPTTDYMLVLRSNHPCNKEIDIEDPDNWKVTSYQKHYLFDFRKLPITDIYTLFDDLKELTTNPYYFFVYGAPTQYALEHAEERMRRRAVSREDQPSTLKPRPASVVGLDIDTMILPGLTYDEAGAREVVKHLIKDGGLKQLKGVTLIYEWTAKAGMKPGHVRIRLIGILEEEATLASIKAWAASSGMADVKIYDPQQPIYIAHPTFINGKPPIKTEDRIGLIEEEFDEIAAIPHVGEEIAKDVAQDAANNDVVLAKLYAEGRVKNKVSAGKYEITCPWVAEHTDAKDSGTVFMLPNFDGFSQHAFKCQHEHCKDRTFIDLLAVLNVKFKQQNEVLDTEDEDDGSITALTKRYAYVKAQDKFFDFITGQLLKIESLNRSYSHIHMRPQAGTALLRRPDLIRADNMVYLPGHPRVTEWENMQVINMWKHVEHIEPKKGDAKPWLNHLKWLMKDLQDREQFLDWSAFLLQNQAIKINHALLIGGPPRIGKDTLLEPLKRYLGTYNVSEPSAEELKETFTDYLHHKKLVVFQECQNFDKLNVENKLKPMLAAPPHTLRVRLFGQGFYETPNLVQCIFMSNHRNALKISRGDGRYYTIWCEVSRKPDTYYAELYNWLNSEGYQIVINYLLERDISHFDPTAPPRMNEYKTLITEMSGTDLEMALLDRISNKEPPFHKDIIKPSDIVQNGGWEGVTVKRFVTALDSLGSIPRKLKANVDGERTQHNLWAIRRQEVWLKATNQRWLKEFKRT